MRLIAMKGYDHILEYGLGRLLEVYISFLYLP